MNTLTIANIRDILIKSGWRMDSVDNLIIPWLEEKLEIFVLGEAYAFERWRMFLMEHNTISQSVIVSNAIEGVKVVENNNSFSGFLDYKIRLYFTVVQETFG